MNDPNKIPSRSESLAYAKAKENVIKAGGKRQVDKFKEAARELETDNDEARFDERLNKIVKAPVKKDKESAKE